jgi:sugar phosphate isomerase/epimerase
MPRLKIALCVESLGLGAKAGIVAAGELGVEGVELDGTRGDTSPENLSRTGRREVLRFISSRRLQICALSADLGIPFDDPRRADEIAERMQRIVELAVDLGTSVVVAPAISAPKKEAEGGSTVASELLADLGKMAANYARFLAVRTGLNDGKTMSAFLQSAGEGAAAAFDPAALLTGGFDPVQAIGDLGKKIVHAYARDAVGPGTGRARVVPLGQGQVNFQEMLAALDGVRYDRFFAIESTSREDPLASAEQARNFLRQF